MTRRYFGSAAHFIAASSCQFHIATQIGDVVISTVGDYMPRIRGGEYRQEIGFNRFFETMVFRVSGPCECGCGMPEHDGREIDFAGYQTRTEANDGHEAMCVKWEHGIAPARADVTEEATASA